MNDPNLLSLNGCPKCGAELDFQWTVCPICHSRLRPDPDPSTDGIRLRGILWVFGSLAFMALNSLIAAHVALGLAAILGIFFWLTLTFVVGKSIVVQMLGSPLTWQRLRERKLHTAMTALGTIVVLPFVIGISLLIFAAMICSGVTGG